MHTRLLLVALPAFGCGMGKRPQLERAAAPQAGAPDDIAAAGQTACEAATRGWPENDRLDGIIEARMQAGRLPGLAACIVKDGDVAWCGGYGTTQADGGGVPVTADTPFLWASVSKLVTATAVGIAMESGHLSFEQDVDTLLEPTVQHPRSSRPIRLDAVLAHVGGIQDNDRVMDDYYARDVDPRLSLAEVVDRYFDPEGADYDPRRNFLADGPESTNRYSNMGYALAGAAVAGATGVDFAAYTEQHIFEALGMSNTGWRLAGFDQDRLAEPTSWRDGAWKGHGHTTFADYPNGGLRSSAHDMACFTAWAARGGDLYGTRLLQTETLHKMMAPAFPRLDPDQGLGWYYEDLGDPTLWVGHSGGEAGVASDLFMRQDGSLAIVLVANGDWGNEQAILDIEDALVAFGREL